MPHSSNPLSRRLRRSLRTLVATTVASAAALSLAPSAHAGEYRVYGCHDPVGRVASTADWDGYAAGTGPVPATLDCGKYGWTYTTLGPGQHRTGAVTGFGLTVPASLKIKRVYASRWALLMGGADTNATVEYDMLAGDTPWDFSAGRALESCDFSAGCGGWAWNAPEGHPDANVEHRFERGVRFVGFALSCRGLLYGSCGGSENYRGHLRLNRMDLTIEDAIPPTLTNIAGSITQDGPRRGVQTLSFSGADEGAGVYHTFVKVDGQEVARDHPDARASCRDAGAFSDYDLEFDRVQPCAGQATATFPIDTTTLADGTHRLDAYVRDAAGNLSGAYSRNFVVDNVPAPTVVAKPTITGPTLASGLRPSDAIAAQNGTWVGAGITFTQRWQRSTPAGGWIDIPNGTGGTYRVGTDDVDHQLRVVVTATNADGSTDAAAEATGTVTSGKTVVVQGVKPDASGGGVVPTGSGNGGGGNPATGQLVVDREQRTVEVKYAAKVVITGRLVDADGNPIADASVDVFEQIAVTAAPWTKVDTVKTDSQGGYVYRPKTTSSRRLRFGFSELRGDATYRATREVFVSVTAGMTIKARSKMVPRGGLIRIGGQVIVDKLPASGALVEVQVLDAGVWRTVATRRANRSGQWSFKHRLRGASATRFTFRARLRTAGDLPSAEAKSAALKVRVR